MSDELLHEKSAERDAPFFSPVLVLANAPNRSVACGTS